jgi:superfamily II DNA or RNA helicase
MSDVHLKHINSVYCKLVCEPSVLMNIADHLTYFAQNYKHDKRYQNKLWDGKIRLVNKMTGLVYAGLAKKIKKYCDAMDYSFSFDEELTYDSVSEAELTDFIETLGIPKDKATRGYQFDSMIKCLRSKRRTLISPTSSGKSLMIYIISRWYNKRTLIIVPTVGLVTQMESDFRSYGFTGSISTSLGGLDKSDVIDADVVITTWQSLDNGKTKKSTKWYDQFSVVFGDEAHGCKATSLKSILSSMENTPYRFGTTGTLDGHDLHEVTIEGLFGPQYRSISTREMIDQGYASKFKIKCIILKYPEEICKQMKGKTYLEEIAFLMQHDKRTNFIRDLSRSLKGNKLIFFRFADHGKAIHQSLVDTQRDGEALFYIDQTVKPKERERIRKALEHENNATLSASLGTTATGISVNRLMHMISAFPSKSRTRVLQAIGRMLRLHEDKAETGSILYDIVDDLSYKRNKNITLNHFEERVKMYDAEQHDYKIYNVLLK